MSDLVRKRREGQLITDRDEKLSRELANQLILTEFVTSFREKYPERNPFTQSILCELHSITVRDIYSCAGQPRLNATDIVEIEAEFIPSHPVDVRLKLPELLNKTERWEEFVEQLTPHYSKGTKLVQASRHARIGFAAKCFHEFEVIHPFRGGNGRVGRAFLHLILYEMSVLNPPFHLFAFISRRRLRYLEVLQFADRGNFLPLCAYLDRGCTEAVLTPTIDTLSQAPIFAELKKRMGQEHRRFFEHRYRDRISDESYVREMTAFGKTLERTLNYLKL